MSRCLQCGEDLNDDSGIGLRGEVALLKPGELTWCAECGHLTRFVSRGVYRRITLAELEEEMMARDWPEVKADIDSIRAAHEQRYWG
jgi:hypothetical protein